MLRKCKTCDSTNLSYSREIGGYKLLKCRYCLVEFVSNPPRRNLIKLYNLEKYNTEKSEEVYLSRQNIFEQRANKIIDTVLMYKPKGKVLDIGCSYGFFLRVFKKRGFDVYGIDISERAVEFLRKKFRIKAIKGDFTNFIFKKKSFDIVIMGDIIEHFSFPDEIIKKVNKILNPNGILIIQTPNIGSFISKISGDKWFWLLVPQHLFLYSIPSLKILLSKYRFEILKVSTWDDFDELVKNILYLLKLKDKGKTKYIYYLLYKILILLYPLSLLWSYFNLGGEIIIYAQKK